jgi:hypothetical protein
MRAPSSRASSRASRDDIASPAPPSAPGSLARSVQSVTRELFVGTPEAVAAVPDDSRNSRADDDAVASPRPPSPGGASALDLGASRAARQLRAGPERWYITAEDGAKELAKWQIATAKSRRRADAAEGQLVELRALNASLTERLRREHDARRVLENELGVAFASPVVHDALRSHVEGDATGAITATRVFRALETRVVRDRAALEAADDRELRLVADAKKAEAEKLAAFEVAKRAQEELRAHVARLRVDNEIRERAARETSEDAARNAHQLPVALDALAKAEAELEVLRANEKNREEMQRVAIRAAVSAALRERRDEDARECAKLREALSAARTRLGERDWEHARASESAEAEHAASLAGIVARARDLEAALEEARREARHADAERARVAEEAGAIVERAVAQREWALDALQRAADAQETHALEMHHEVYSAALLAMPEAAVRVGDESLAAEARAAAEAARAALSSVRECLRETARDAAALALARDVARRAGVARGWAAALRVADEATATADAKSYAAVRRVKAKIREGFLDARHDARRGVARRRLLAHLGAELEPVEGEDLKRLFDDQGEDEGGPDTRAPELAASPPPATPAASAAVLEPRDANARDRRAEVDTPEVSARSKPRRSGDSPRAREGEAPGFSAEGASPGPGGDYFYDAETTVERTEGGPTTPRGMRDETPSWIARARTAASARSASRARTKPKESRRASPDAEENIHTATPGTGPASARRQLAFASSESFQTPPTAFPKAEATPAERLAAATRATPASDGVHAGYTPSRAAAREIETLVKSLRF